MANRRVWTLRLALVGAALAAAAAIFVALRGEPDATASPPAQPPASVVTHRIDATKLTAEQRYLGELRAVSHAALTVGEAGLVKQVMVREGDRVKEGQLLLELDDRLARAQLGEAQATRESVQAEKAYADRRVDDMQRLERQKAASRGEAARQEADARVLDARTDAAGASLRAQARRIERHRITAPFDGVVSRRHIDQGAWLHAGEPAIELVTDSRVEVLVRVPPNLLDQLEALQGIELHKDRHKVAASLEGVVDALDPSTRTALLRLSPSERPDWLRSGDTVHVAFLVEHDGGLAVPRDALVHGVHVVRVIRVTDGKAEPVDVKVLVEAGDRVLIAADGLSLGDELIVRGNERLRPGQPVTTEGALNKPAASGK
jgi:RND family efflux transporter MFP subunit